MPCTATHLAGNPFPAELHQIAVRSDRLFLWCSRSPDILASPSVPPHPAPATATTRPGVIPGVFRKTPQRLSRTDIKALSTVARRPTTWKVQPGPHLYTRAGSGDSVDVADYHLV